MSAEERVDGMQIIRFGNVFTTSPRFLLCRSKDALRWSDAIVEEVIGGLRVPYLSGWFADLPHLCFWYQRNRLIFAAQYGPRLGVFLSLFESAVARLYRNATILTLSEASRRDLVELGLQADRIRVCRPGINQDLLRHATTLTNGREPTLLVIGKFRRYKRLEAAIEVLQRLHELGILDANLVIAGRREDDRYRRELLDLARELGVAQYVRIECDITEERKAELLGRARLLLITSPIEGFGMTAIEANAFGVPVLATTGVPEDAVIEGFTGYRLPSGDIDGMAGQAARLLSRDAEWRSLSQNATAFARNWTWDATLDPVRSALRELGI
jgi:glycosyltransferase involved in cell wall biosynthesis